MKSTNVIGDGKMKVTAVVGAQYGSEGKGSIVRAIANEYAIHVRTGGPNAGHTIHHMGETYKMQVIPCGWVNPEAILVIGRGAMLDFDRLQTEMDGLTRNNYSISNRLMIDKQCSMLESAHHQMEGGIQGPMHKSIGSTGEGVGACRMHRMERSPNGGHKMAGDYPQLQDTGMLTDTVEYFHTMKNWGSTVLLEGTQGAGLSLVHGDWPYVTSADTTAGQFAVDAGLNPRQITDVILVARTYPIRVAGNSGPLFGEITWDHISERMGREVVETTTVTGKVRRIGQWDEELFIKACRLNGPTQVAINFMDYLSPADEGVDKYDDLSKTSRQFVEYLERLADCPVTMIGTGGPKCEVIRR